MKERSLTPAEGAPRFAEMLHLVQNNLDYQPEPKWKQFQRARKEDKKRATSCSWSGNRVLNSLPTGDRE